MTTILQREQTPNAGDWVDIPGSTAFSYISTLSDVGHRLRVKETVGGVIAYSTPFGPVVGIPSSSAYITERLDGALSNPSLWYYSPVDPSNPLWGRHFSWVPGFSGQALRITAPAAQSPGVLADGTPVPSSSVSGQLVALESPVTSAVIPNIHCGWASGDPAGTGAVGKHEESWHRVKIRWPSGYRPTLGTQNGTHENHYDRGTMAALGYAVSPAIIVEGVGGTSTTIGGVTFDTVPSNVNQVLYQFPGKTGDNGLGTRQQIISGAEFQFDHWYDFVIHYIFDVNPAIGLVELWVDGVQKINSQRITSYLRPNNSWGYQEDCGIYNYRHWANWSSSTDYDELTWGPDRGSIGF